MTYKQALKEIEEGRATTACRYNSTLPEEGIFKIDGKVLPVVTFKGKSANDWYVTNAPELPSTFHSKA